MVMTFSLVDTGCDGGRTVNPPPPEPSPSATAGGEGETPQPESAPQPEPTPEPVAGKPARNIEQMPDGTCMEYFDVDCPDDGRTCNPPPPQKIQCPESVLPAATDATRVTMRPNGECWEAQGSKDFKCPEGAVCNPPPPKRVKCPDAVLPEAADPKTVHARPDGTCWEEVDIDCKPDATCNPPPPRRVKCVEPPA